MPVTATLGALTYNKVSLDTAGTYDNWFLQTTSSYSFNSIAFDSANAFYVSSATNNSIAKFVEQPYPAVVWAKIYGYFTTLNEIKYNSFSNTMSVAASRTQNSTTNPFTPISLGETGNTNISTGNITLVENGYKSGAGFSSYFATCVASNPTNGVMMSGGSDKSSSNVYTAAIRNDVSQGGAQFTGSNTTTTGVIWSTDGKPVYVATGYTGTSSRTIIIAKLPYPGTFFPDALFPAIWQMQLTLNNFLVSTKIAMDSVGSFYILVNDTSAVRGYIIKYNSSGVLQWQRTIALSQLQNLTIDSSDNIYVTGRTSTNLLYIARYNTSGTIQWQRRMSGFTFVGYGIQYYDNNLYIAGSSSSLGFIVKLPSDGTIPGTGTYFYGATALVYDAATNTETAGTLVSATNTLTSASDNMNIYNTGTGGVAIGISKGIISL